MEKILLNFVIVLLFATTPLTAMKMKIGVILEDAGDGSVLIHQAVFNQKEFEAKLEQSGSLRYSS